MKLIRHILSHLILISVIAGVCAVYFYRYQILLGKYVEKIDHYAEKIHPRLVTIASKVQLDEEDKPLELVSRQSENTSADLAQSSAVEKAPPELKLAEVEPELEKAAEDVVSDKDVSKEQPVVADMAMADVPVAEEEKPQTVTNNVITEQPAEKDKITSTVSISDEKPADNQQVPATDKEAAGASSLLREARSAFNKGELDVSIAKYNELIEAWNSYARENGFVESDRPVAYAKPPRYNSY